jgi:hypothetical protein
MRDRERDYRVAREYGTIQHRVACHMTNADGDP